MNDLEKRAVIALSGVFGLRMFGLFLVLPMIALYVAGLHGATPFLIGLSLGAYGLTQALLQIPFGILSDRFGRKPLIVFGLVVFCIGSIVAAVADTAAGVVIGRALQGSGAVAAVILAFVADLTRDQQRIKAMAIIGISMGGSFLLALMVGPVLDRLIGVSGLFWITVFLSILAIGLVLWVVPTPRIVSHDSSVNASSEYLREALRDFQLMRMNFGIFTLHMILTSVFIAIPFELIHTVELAQSEHWRIYIPVLLGSVVLMAPLLFIGMRREQTFNIFRISIIILMLAHLIMLFGLNSKISLVAGILVFFISFNVLEAMLPSLVTRLVSSYKKGTAMGIYNTFEFSGVFIGGVAGGLIYGFWGSSGVFMFCAIAAAFWLVFCFFGKAPILRECITINIKAKSEIEFMELETSLLSLKGVDDVTVMPSQKIAYLRVNETLFDPDAAAEVSGVEIIT